MTLWQAAIPLLGSIGERYLSETRGIDVGKLPADIHESLRFHPRCPFGSDTAPCILALMRDPLGDTPVGIHRIGLKSADGKVSKLDRRALGQMGVVKLWPANGTLTIGEGIETVLAAATRLSHETPLIPAWSAVSSGGLAKLPVIPWRALARTAGRQRSGGIGRGRQARAALARRRAGGDPAAPRHARCRF